MLNKSDNLQLATQAHESGDWVHAARLYNSILTDDPNNKSVLHQFGTLCYQAGKYQESLDLLARAVELADDSTQAAKLRVDIAAALLAEDRVPEALAACELARDFVHSSDAGPKLLLLQSQAFRKLDQLADSIEVLQDAARQYPDHEPIHVALAHAYRDQGDVESAAQEFEKILELNPKQSEAVLHLTHLMLEGDVPIGLPWIKRIQAILPYAADDSVRIPLRFALGAVHRQRGEDEQAMAALRQANHDQAQQMALHGSTFCYDHFVELVDQIIDQFQVETITDLQNRYGNPTTQPLFMVGMPGGGHEQWIGREQRNGNVTAWDEAPLLDGLIDGLFASADSYPIGISEIPAENWTRKRNEYLDSIHRIAPFADHVVNPRPGNALYVGVIAAMFPQARIVHCVRDREATLMDCFSTPRPLDRIATADLRELRDIYDQVERLMAHWKHVVRIETVNMHV